MRQKGRRGHSATPLQLNWLLYRSIESQPVSSYSFCSHSLVVIVGQGGWCRRKPCLLGRVNGLRLRYPCSCGIEYLSSYPLSEIGIMKGSAVVRIVPLLRLPCMQVASKDLRATVAIPLTIQANDQAQLTEHWLCCFLMAALSLMLSTLTLVPQLWNYLPAPLKALKVK